MNCVTLTLLSIALAAANALHVQPRAVLTAGPKGCGFGMYQCADSLCIPSRFICDGVYNCVTLDDEQNCDITCSQFQYQCDDMHCIPQESVCNGIVDCSTYDDEVKCKNSTSLKHKDSSGDCGFGMYLCADHLCIPHSLVCDGVYDCTTLDDEKDCAMADSTSLKHKDSSGDCGFGMYLCADHLCIPHSLVCDGVYDCTTLDDEKDCAMAGDHAAEDVVAEDHAAKSTCADLFFQCDNGLCVPEKMVCDGIWNCVTGTDERNCEL